MAGKEHERLSLNDLGELVKVDGKLVVCQEFNEVEISLYFVEGEVIEIWMNTTTGDVSKVLHVWESKIDPFLKYLEISTLN